MTGLLFLAVWGIGTGILRAVAGDGWAIGFSVAFPLAVFGAAHLLEKLGVKAPR